VGHSSVMRGVTLSIPTLRLMCQLDDSARALVSAATCEELLVFLHVP
jgi:hypothetical protein